MAVIQFVISAAWCRSTQRSSQGSVENKASSSFIPHFPFPKGLMTSQLLVTSQMQDHMSETFEPDLYPLQPWPLEGKRAVRCPRGWRQGRSSEQEHLTHMWVCLCGQPDCAQLAISLRRHLPYVCELQSPNYLHVNIWVLLISTHDNEWGMALVKNKKEKN